MEHSSTGAILHATYFAARRHKDQRRKGADAAPYINHPIDLAHTLWYEAGVRDEAVIVAALLHDTVEDTSTTFEELEQEFGALVRGLVAEVTDDKSLPKAARKQHQVDHAPQLSDRARLIKLADKISNLRDIISTPPDGWSLQRRLDYFEWGKQVIDQIRGSHAGLEALFDEVYTKGVAQIMAEAEVEAEAES